MPRKLAYNPLPWVLGSDMTFSLDEPTLRTAFEDLRSLGATAIHADIPPGMTPAAYRAMLEEYGMEPAPGFFSGPFEDTERFEATLEAAKAHAADQAALGLTEVFVCGGMSELRIARPAVGASADEQRLEETVRQLERIAPAMIAEGVRPAYHPHVGFWIEIESEIRHLLDRTDPDVLDFGPDVGHLTWAGADPVELLRQYRDRIGAVHLKDVDDAAVSAARSAGADYWTSTLVHHVWTEPGRGQVDFDAVFAALGEDFDGWFVLEVDVPNLNSDRVDSARASLDWAARSEYLNGTPA